MSNSATVTLLMGEYGVGKTTECARLANVAECGEVMFANIDNGLQSIYQADGTLAPGCHVTPWLDSPSEIEVALRKLWRREGVPSAVNTLVLDSLSAIDLRALDKAFGDTNPFSWDDPSASFKDPRKPFGHRATIVQSYARAAPSAPYRHVIITAHTKERLTEKGAVEAILPLVGSANTINIVGGACTHVFHLGLTPSGKRQLTVNNTGIIRAKCRSQALCAAIGGVPTTLKSLAELIQYL